jgi:murein DD-endopeptidase MepM/ murein hydrolase activator NlpD
MRLVVLTGWFVIAAAGPLHSGSDGIGRVAPAKDQLTPVTASLLAPNDPAAVLGTDGKYHVLYELVLTNARGSPATIQKISVVDAANPSATLAGYEGAALLDGLRDPSHTKAPATDAVVAPNTVRLFLVDLAFAGRPAVPRKVAHRLDLMAATNPAASAPGSTSYTVAAVSFGGPKPIVLGPPLRGKGWVVTNGCCGNSQAHRPTILPVNGAMWDSQRFAIDYMRLDDHGRLVHGDEADVHNYADYGSEVVSVVDATVVATLDQLDDQVPGQLPDPSTITVENVDGNHVVTTLGGGRYAFYAHLQKGSVMVKPGDKVKRGQVIGKLGNTGNTSAPHLHFHVMDSASVLGSDGLPYVIDQFDTDGQINGDRLAAAKTIEGDYSDGISAHPTHRSREFPLDLDIVGFPGR